MKYKLFLLAVLTLLVASCEKTDDLPETHLATSQHTLTVTAAAPAVGGNNTAPDTRLSLKMGETMISVTWSAGDKIMPYFVQGTAIVQGTEITLESENLSEDKKNANFDIALPSAGIDPQQSYTLYCVHGISSKINKDEFLLISTIHPFFLFPMTALRRLFSHPLSRLPK